MDCNKVVKCSFGVKPHSWYIMPIADDRKAITLEELERRGAENHRPVPYFKHD